MDVRQHVVYGMASFAIMCGANAYAVGLGEIRVDSALHQPLQASIMLHGADGLTPSDIAVSLADVEMFEKMGIERSHFLSSIRFIPVVQGKNLLVEVQSSGPVVEPYLNFLVQLKRPNGTLLREYTLLFDPPLYQPTAVVGAMPAVASTTSYALAKTEKLRSPSVLPPPSLPDLEPQPQAKRYEAQAGDNLWVIAQMTRVDNSVPVRRQMLAIRSLNPDAFIDGDMNRLRAGKQLILPTAQQVGAKPQKIPSELIAESDLSIETPTEIEPAALATGRLRIAESSDQSASENAELQQRMSMLETRFHALLDQLNARDRQIASLQAELDILRRARDAEVTLAAQSASPATETNNLEFAGLQLANAAAVPGAVSKDPLEIQSAENPTQRSIMDWWPLLMALLATLVGVIIFRLRQHHTEAPSPHLDQIPAATPLENQDTDVLEGAALYVAYDRHSEAKALLDKAIDDEPQRMDLRLRQLAVLAELGDAAGFAEQERKLLSMGAEAGPIDLLKTRLLAVTDHTTVDNKLWPDDPAQYPSGPGVKGHTGPIAPALLEEDEFNLDADWDVIDDPDSYASGHRSQHADESFKEYFETNLNDYPEVKEVDEDIFEDLIAPQKRSVDH